ncbi:hypothetical protein Dda_5610 [Drechslerella dactyloides]|uniref:Uncharacterized protein n=1 Tax=Drechslerella dactyloides TaxID=74499 RepID=A0AAD6J0M9_DREDA|nr:hypothetical protein Dda_5610 [Drechslerella dactyloides]
MRIAPIFILECVCKLASATNALRRFADSEPDSLKERRRVLQIAAWEYASQESLRVKPEGFSKGTWQIPNAQT